MVLRTPRNWSDAAGFLGGFDDTFMQGLLDAIRRGQATGAGASGANPFAVPQGADAALREMRQASNRQARLVQQSQRAAVQDQRHDVQRARTMSQHDGGRGFGGALGGADRVGGAGGGRSAIPDGVVVPEAIRRGNPNIGRAEGFDISQTNPHAAALVDSLRANGVFAPRNAGESIDLAGQGGGAAKAAQMIAETWRRATSGSGSREVGGGSQATASKPGALTATPVPGRLGAQTPNQQHTLAGGDPLEGLAARIAGDVRGRLGAPDAGSARAAVEGLMGLPDADALVASIRARAAASAANAARQGITPANGQPSLAPNQPTATKPGGLSGGMSAPWPNTPNVMQPTSDIIPAGLGGTGDLRTNGLNRTVYGDQIAAANQGSPAGGVRAFPDSGFQNPEMSIVANPNGGSVGGSVGAPTGVIQSNVANNGVPWDNVNQYDASFVAAQETYGVPASLLKAMMVIESGGVNTCRGEDGHGGGAACGPMQVKGDLWNGLAGCYDQNDPNCNIMTAAALLKQGYDQTGSWEGAIQSVYFPADDMGTGISQGQYVAEAMRLMAVIDGAAPAGTAAGPGVGGPAIGSNAPAGGPAIPGSDIYLPGGGPVPQQPSGAFDPNVAFPGSDAKIANVTTPPVAGADATAPVGPTTGVRPPVASGTISTAPATDGMGLMAGADADETYLETMAPGMAVSTDYKQPVTWVVPQLGDCPYCYQVGHGADGSTHAAMDIVAPGGYGAAIASPVQGKVVCSGGGQGSSVPGWNCNYAVGCTFEDSCGAGQITLDIGADASGNQLLINMIHLSGSTVQDGQIVNAGDQIGNQGSMGGMVHTHLEALAICNGNYIYLDPTLVIDGYYTGRNACEGY